MTLVPIVERELRSAARQDFTYYLRLVGAAGLLVALTAFLIFKMDEPNPGSHLFAHLHFTLFGAIWFVVPSLTADCISQERRDGTLGLLFLTRLNARDVVIAKSLAQGLRAFTLWLAVLPVMAVPFLLGGVSWTEVLVSCLVHFSAICLALTSGLIASAISRSWTRVMTCAGFLSGCFCVGFVLVFIVWVSFTLPGGASVRSELWRRGLFPAVLAGFQAAVDWGACWPEIFSRFGSRVRSWWLEGSALIVLGSALFLLLAIRFVARCVRGMWREEPPSPAMRWLQRRFLQPIVFRNFFRRWMKQKLDHNPVGWLEQRSWSGRMVAWGWLGLVAFLYSGALSEGMMFSRGGSNPLFIHQPMAWLLGASMAFSAAGSFRRERESGVLELLLVSPLGEEEIISGRVRGLWAQFFPAAALLVGIWCFLTTMFGFTSPNDDVPDMIALVYYAVGFLGLPVIGLYFSLACRSFLTALLGTLAIGLLAAPVLTLWLSWAWRWVFFVGGPSGDMFLLHGPMLPIQLLLTLFCWFGLSARLRRRNFPIQRSA
jgi:ABC-type transport system involved in multi-copper enzyme maturation permease subunit